MAPVRQAGAESGRRMPNRAIFAALLALILTCPAAGEDFSSAVEAADFEPAEKARLRSLFETAERQSLPADLLLPRLQEGLAKRVPPARLFGALEKDLEAFRLAGRILSEKIPAGDPRRSLESLRSTGYLAAAGADRGLIELLLSAAGSRPADYRAGCGLYLGLAAWGLRPDQAAAVAAAALSSKLPASAFEGVGNLFALGRRQRLDPDRLADELIARLPAAESLERLREQSLKIK